MIPKVETPGGPPWGRSKPSQVHSRGVHYTKGGGSCLCVSWKVHGHGVIPGEEGVACS